MRRLAVLVMVFLVAALPLRGMAAFAADPCASLHGVAADAANHQDAGQDCDHAASHREAPPHTGQGHEGGNGADSCAHCVACVAGCGLMAEMPTFDVARPPGVERIPFRPPHAGGHFPTLPDRPPLAL